MEVKIKTSYGGLKNISEIIKDLREETNLYYDFIDGEWLPVDEYVRKLERRALRKALLSREKRGE